jgi:hypothetical protein
MATDDTSHRLTRLTSSTFPNNLLPIPLIENDDRPLCMVALGNPVGIPPCGEPSKQRNEYYGYHLHGTV